MGRGPPKVVPRYAPQTEKPPSARRAWAVARKIRAAAPSPIQPKTNTRTQNCPCVLPSKPASQTNFKPLPNTQFNPLSTPLTHSHQTPIKLTQKPPLIHASHIKNMN